MEENELNIKFYRNHELPDHIFEPINDLTCKLCHEVKRLTKNIHPTISISAMISTYVIFIQNSIDAKQVKLAYQSTIEALRKNMEINENGEFFNE